MGKKSNNYYNKYLKKVFYFIVENGEDYKEI